MKMKVKNESKKQREKMSDVTVRDKSVEEKGKTVLNQGGEDDIEEVFLKEEGKEEGKEEMKNRLKIEGNDAMNQSTPSIPFSLFLPFLSLDQSLVIESDEKKEKEKVRNKETEKGEENGMEKEKEIDMEKEKEKEKEKGKEKEMEKDDLIRDLMTWQPYQREEEKNSFQPTDIFSFLEWFCAPEQRYVLQTIF